MAKNVYFENFANSREQELIEDLIIETIKIHGIEVWYMPRNINEEDRILNEDDLSTFTKAYLLEMYIKEVDGFGGEGDFLSKFGLQIRDSMTLTVAQRVFDGEVNNYTGKLRPNEGDLIYFPLNGKIFELMHTEHEAIFYQMGALQTYDLRFELFEYSGEVFNTGIEEIDSRYTDYDMTTNNAIANVDSVDTFADNHPLETEADAILDFTENNPFGEDEY